MSHNRLGLLLSSPLFLLLMPFRLLAKEEGNCDFAKMLEGNDKSLLKPMCDDSNSADNHFIYCSGRILQAVNYHQLLPLTNGKGDSKDFVDRPMKADAEIVLTAFKQFDGKKVEDINPNELKVFVDKYFNQADDTSVALKSCDLYGEDKAYIKQFANLPKKFEEIKDTKMQKWAEDLHKRWQDLCRFIDPKVESSQKTASLIYAKRPFIVPGGRFREYYYWDSLWTIKGLLASGLNDMARDMILNFFDLVKDKGFVPNGGRVYYLRRSQPPLLTPMVYEYYSHTRDRVFLKDALPILEKELAFWEGQRVDFKKDGREFNMYRYRVNSTVPRPESFCDDVNTAQDMVEADQEKGDDNGAPTTLFEARKSLWRNLASAAESGWDFSSRWMADPANPKLKQIITSQIVPVDLNAYLCGNLQLLSKLYHQIGDNKKALEYHSEYQKFREDFRQVFFVNDPAGWYDWNMQDKTNNVRFYASMLVPLYTQCYETIDLELPERIYNTTEAFGAIQAHGVPTSMTEDSGQQWDYPNIWPPLQHMIIEGFRRSGNKNMAGKAFDMAKKWLSINYSLFMNCDKRRMMWEKLSVHGKEGKGGEYDVQGGFGWTNGAVLDLLLTYKDRIIFDEKLPECP